MIHYIKGTGTFNYKDSKKKTLMALQINVLTRDKVLDRGTVDIYWGGGNAKNLYSWVLIVNLSLIARQFVYDSYSKLLLTMIYEKFGSRAVNYIFITNISIGKHHYFNLDN